MSPVGRMILDGQWEDLARAARERFNIEISAEQMELQVRQKPLMPWMQSEDHWSDDSWWCWIRNRLNNGVILGRPGCSSLPIDDGWRCVFHLGFLSIIETPEELDRLQRGETGRKRNYNNPARSVIFRELPKGNVHPIDRTAMIVAPEDHP
jgi:hypothetical protein